MYIAFSSQLSTHKPLWRVITLPQGMTQRTAWSTMLPSARVSEGHLRVEDSALLRLHGRNALEMQTKWLSQRQTWIRNTSKDGATTTESKKVNKWLKRNSWPVNVIFQPSSTRTPNTSPSSKKHGASKRMVILRFISRILRPSFKLWD